MKWSDSEVILWHEKSELKCCNNVVKKVFYLP